MGAGSASAGALGGRRSRRSTTRSGGPSRRSPEQHPVARSRRGTYTSRRPSAQRLGDVQQEFRRERAAFGRDGAQVLLAEAEDSGRRNDGVHVERAVALQEEGGLAEDLT